MPGAATQIYSREFDAALARLPPPIAALVTSKITELGGRLESFSHFRLSGRAEFRMRVGDYRIIYEFDLEKNHLYLLTLGNRREIYR